VSNERGWIKLAEENGGKMEVRTISLSRCRYSAVMRWPGGAVVCGPVKSDTESAIDSLDERLGEDAANEFLEGSGL
jgi:hypothetical protein